MVVDVILSDGAIRLRAMRDAGDDYALMVRWRNTPHVRQWWDPDDPPMTIEQAIEEYRPSVLGVEPDRPAIIEFQGKPIGFVQYYPWAAFRHELDELGITVPEGAWGLDIFIGEPDGVNRGIGSSVVRLLCNHLFAHEGATAVAFGVERMNARARRAYEKAGMTATVEYLDNDTRGGERVWAVLMVRLGG